MRSAASKLAVALVSAIALAACQNPDVGDPCTLQWGSESSLPPPTPTTTNGDYFQSGNTACDDLVCIVSPAGADSKYATRCSVENGENCGYCSKPCVSNDDCYTSETGLVCDLVLPDPAFIATLDPEVRDRYLGDISFSSFCVVRR
jgi:hypothetical protein